MYFTHSLLTVKELCNGASVHKKTKIEKALRETQTLRAGCSKAEPKMFAQPQTSFLGCGTARI